MTARVIKAGALIADSKILFAHWDVAQSVAANLARFQRENLFGKASRVRVRDMLVVFRQRYLASDEHVQALVWLARNASSSRTFERILYWHAADADPVVRTIVEDLIWPRFVAGDRSVSVDHVQELLVRYSRDGRTTTPWNDATARRVAQGVLSLLRDFGVLEGHVRKSVSVPFVPTPAFAYVAFCLSTPPRGLSGFELITAPEWRLFLLDRAAVERGFLEAHQERFLEYEAAGSTVRIGFPERSLPEYARAITRTTT